MPVSGQDRSPSQPPEQTLGQFAAFDSVAPKMRVFHQITVNGRSEWDVLRLASDCLERSGASLVALNVTRFGARDVSVGLKLAGVAPDAASELVDRLRADAGISHARVEHLMMRAEG